LLLSFRQGGRSEAKKVAKIAKCKHVQFPCFEAENASALRVVVQIDPFIKLKTHAKAKNKKNPVALEL